MNYFQWILVQYRDEASSFSLNEFPLPSIVTHNLNVGLPADDRRDDGKCSSEIAELP